MRATILFSALTVILSVSSAQAYAVRSITYSCDLKSPNSSVQINRNAEVFTGASVVKGGAFQTGISLRFGDFDSYKDTTHPGDFMKMEYTVKNAPIISQVAFDSGADLKGDTWQYPACGNCNQPTLRGQIAMTNRSADLKTFQFDATIQDVRLTGPCIQTKRVK